MAVNKDCVHYNKDRCNCKILNQLYCKIEAKPCNWRKPNPKEEKQEGVKK